MAKNNRSSYQKARVGWKPRQTSKVKLAADIAFSIQTHAEYGVTRTADDYTQDPEVHDLVHSMLTSL